MSPAPADVPNAARMVVFEPADRWPDSTALVFLYPGGELSYTFGEAASRVMALSSDLSEQGVRRADRVALRLPHSPEFVFAFFAVIAIGAVPVATSPSLTDVEFDWIVSDSGAQWIVAAFGSNSDSASNSRKDPRPPGLLSIALTANGAAPPVHASTGRLDEPCGDDPAWMVYTSGTSGRPRGVLHAHRALLAREWMRAGWTGLQTGDRLLHAGQLNWTYTMGCAVMDTWRVGATGILVGSQPTPDMWPGLIRQARATVFAAVPSLYRRVLKYAPAGSLTNLPLRHALTAGEALSPTLLQSWTHATAVPLFEALGMTECSTYLSTGPVTPIRPGSAGRPQPGRTVALLPMDGGVEPVPTGELGVIAIHRSDPGLMLGYHNRRDEEAAMMRGEWFITGDLAVTDADGYFYTRGRNDDLMNASGYRVSPAEVEAVLATHPRVAEVAVTDVEVGDGVRIVCAFIVPSRTSQSAEASEEVDGTAGPGSPLTEAELLYYAAQLLAPWKSPRRVVFANALPRNANGKLLRRELRALAVF